MAGINLKLVLVFVNYLTLCHCEISNMIDEDVLQSKDYVFYPNATIPFYIETLHFDNEQSISIMRSLANFGFRTCIKFMPVLARPEGNQHVMVFENPEGIKKCYIDNKGYSMDGPHKVILGYDCLTSPNIEMMIMKNLGFPFEHNRAIRDIFISVQMENVQPSAYEFFEKDDKLPKDLRALPYDINSVMHFDTRQFSKNGHRTIIIKNDNRGQDRTGLSPIDLRKIDMVYGPECRKRDRQEKVELCQNYPGVARKRRDVEAVTEKVTEKLPLNDPTVNLRVNRDITPPPGGATEGDTKEDVSVSLRELGIEAEVEEIVEHVHKVTALALKNARLKYCNNTKLNLRAGGEIVKTNTSGILEIVENIADYAKAIVVKATSNLTAFCESSESIEMYQRSCPFFDKSRCPQRYKSTKSGAVKVSTQHRPVMKQSTKHWDLKKKWLREGNDSKETAQDSAATKSALRMGTMILSGNRGKYAPNYRSSNDSHVNQSRRRRSVDGNDENDGTTPIVDVVDEKAERTEEKLAANDEKLAANDEKLDANDEKLAANDEKLAKNDEKLAAIEKIVTDEAKVLSKDVNVLTEEKSVKNEEKVEKVEVIASKEPGHVANDKNDKNTEVKSGNDETNDVNSPKLVAPSKHDRNRRKAYSEENENPSDDGVPMQRQNRRQQDDDDYDEERERQKPKRFKKRRPTSREDYEQADEGNGQHYEQEETERPIKKQKRRPQKQRPEIDYENEEASEAGSEEQKKSTKPRGPKPRTIKLSDKNKEFYGDRRWPSGVIPYLITNDPNYDIEDMRKRIEEVNAILKEKTCASLQEISEDQAFNYKDYVILDASPDYVTGHVGGKQRFGVLELFEGGQHRQHAAMMVMAMLGFYFEVARHDRDKYVRVHMRHVRPDKLHHFEKIREDATLPLPYDYKSATHPAWQFWRQLGKTGISTVATFKQQDPDGTIMKSMGQNEEILSELDLVKINSVYGTRCFTNPSNKRDRGRGER